MIRATAIWAAVAAVIIWAIAVAATSPLMAYRSPVYVAACLAGVIALALLLMQPLLAGGYLPGLGRMRGRKLHRPVGVLILVAVGAHVGGLWLTSPPDVIDALLFLSPTPFAPWGVVAMWALLITAGLALLRWPLRLTPRFWRIAHSTLALVIVVGSIVHALLVQGTMGMGSKLALCALVFAATAMTFHDLRIWSLLWRTATNRS